MSQTSGFFNALLTAEGKYDRKYNSEDYSNNLAVIISDGVLRSANDDLRCVADGMNININIGRAWIRGKWYLNDTVYNMVVPTASPVNPRKDCIFLRLDNNTSGRQISFYYAEGTPAQVPTAPVPQDTTFVKDLVLCEIDVPVNATSVTVTDKRPDKSVCGWVYSVKGDDEFFKTLDNDFYMWFDKKKDTLATVTIFKKYVYTTTTHTAGQTVVAFDIPQFERNGYDILEVFFNGRLQVEGVDYTLGEGIVTFNTAKTAGQEVSFHCYKSIDGTGIETIVDRMTAVENKVNTLGDISEYNYICNGADDNVKLSEIAQAFLNGSTSDNKKLTINVYGNLGATAPFAGAGTIDDPYQWFKFGQETSTSRKVVFDFGNCSRIEITVPTATSNILFYGYNMFIKNASALINANANNTAVVCFNCMGRTSIEDCSILINGYNGSFIGYSGDYTRCNFNVRNSAGSSACFKPTNGSLLRINGGEMYAYGVSTATTMVIFVASTATTAVVLVNGLSCPTFAVSGMRQTHAVLDQANSGKCAYNNLITALPISAVGQSVTGTINASVYNKV